MNVINLQRKLILYILLWLLIETTLLLIPEGTSAQDSFPLNLYCNEANLTTEETPVLLEDKNIWNGLVLGISSPNDLAKIMIEYNKLLINIYNTQYDIIKSDAVDNSYTITYLAPPELINREYPLIINSCFKDNKLVVLEVLYGQGNNVSNLAAILTKCKLPDAVTWTETTGGRLLFWFNEGFAVEVFVSQYNQNQFEDIEAYSFIYLIPQSANNFETRWPYNRTPSEPVLSDLYDSAAVTDQNPFNFEEWLLTPAPTIETSLPTLSSTNIPSSNINIFIEPEVCS